MAKPTPLPDLTAQSLAVRCARLQQQAEATLEINRRICNTDDLDELLMLIAESCRNLLQCEVAGFALLQEQEPHIAWRAWSGCRTDYRNVVFPKRGGIAGRAMSSRRPVMLHDLNKRKDAASEFPISFSEGLRSVLGVPLEIMNAPSGCLMIGFRHIHDFTPDEIDTLCSFASQAAIAVENARLYESLRSEQARLESVVQSINEGLVLVGLDERLAYVNRQARELLRLGDEEPLGLDLAGFFEHIALDATDPPGVRKELFKLDAIVSGFPTVDVQLSGSPAVAIRLTRFVVYDSKGERLGRGFLCRDVTLERQADAMKSEVISLVSHELRTPLALIRGYASALLDGTKSRSAALRREYLTTIDTESSRLDELVSKLTDVSKLDQGLFDLDMHDVDPVALVRAVVGRWRKATSERTFTLRAEDKLGAVRIDRKRIEQVFDNLLSNAVKYSPQESAIALGVEQHQDSIVFSVTDRGPGIPAEQRQRVFERFFRAQVRGRKRDGSGLGLYIARGIVSAHGGRIWLDSKTARGTTVFFSVPSGH